MQITEKLREFHNRLEEAMSYEDWEEVSEVNLDLELLLRDLDSSFPMDFDSEY